MYNFDSLVAAKDSFNESLFRWKFDDGVQIKFASIQYEKDVRDYQGQPHDFYGFDEITEFTEGQFRFVTGWNRSTRPGQRCRVIATGNPPTDPEGEWILKYWGPWLDSTHPNPAQHGELRWFTTIDGKDIEVENGKPFLYKGETIQPKSRTFILALLGDNPALRDTGYRATLQALPEPLRSKMLFGDFKAGSEDHIWQIIPSEWIRLAQERWRARKKPTTPLSALGVDVARGGKDKTIMAPRYDNYYDELLSFPGSATPDGQAVAGQVKIALNGNTTARVNIDIIGVGSSPYDFTKSFHKETYPMNSSTGTDERDKSKQLGFVNSRAQWWWQFREALDPSSGQDIALPADDRELAVDLCAPRWKLTPRGIQVEAKDEIKARIGRSPDKGDAVVYSSATIQMPGAGWSAFFKEKAAEAEASQTVANTGGFHH